MLGSKRHHRTGTFHAEAHQNSKLEQGITMLLLKLYPNILAKGSFQARERIVKAFEHYFRDNGYCEGSDLVKCRYKHNSEHHIPASDIARFEVGGAFAILANTGPTAFWFIYHIYSDAVVLEDCRRELSKVVQEKNGVSELDLSDLKESCPVLLSTFQEVLRFHGVGVSTRVALEDHMLNNQYLLKKGSMLMIPGGVQHTIKSVWGPNADEFYHKRFLRSEGGKRPNPVAFRGFGGGSVLCPGRHFATTEIIAFAALLLMRYDIWPCRGQWSQPKTDNAPMWATVPAPDEDIVVSMSLRNHREWSVSFSGSDKAMEITVEDSAVSDK